MKSALCKSILLILQIIIHSPNAVSSERGKYIDQSIENLVGLIANISANGFNENYPETLKDIVSEIDSVFYDLKKHQAELEMETQFYRQLKMDLENQVQLIEAQFQGLDAEATSSLLQNQRDALAIRQVFRNINKNLKLRQYLTKFTKEVRDHVKHVLRVDLQLQALNSRDPNPSQNLLQKLQLELELLSRRLVEFRQHTDLTKDHMQRKLTEMASFVKKYEESHDDNKPFRLQSNRVEF